MTTPISLFAIGFPQSRMTLKVATLVVCLQAFACPPNASLAFADRGVESAVVLELTEPVLDGTTLTFRARVLQGTPPASFADASLFIDSGGMMQLVAYGAQ